MKFSTIPTVSIFFIWFQLTTQATEAFQFGSLFSTSTSSSSSSSSSTIRLRTSKPRRPESCRENLPRKSEDLPALVIVGRIREVYLDQVELNGSGPGNEQASTTTTQAPITTANRALVNIGRVLKGNKQLVGSDVIVSGFNGASQANPCPNYIKLNDTLILLLDNDGDRKYSIQGNNVLSLNLNNLDKINAIANDELYKRRGAIEDILCEAHYCAYGRCVANERGQVSCNCPESCPSILIPVCGSDNVTYKNECQLIMEGCRLKRPLFVTKESSCNRNDGSSQSV